MANSFTPQQIEQFLQEFFDVVGARQYIGARYVPIFGRAGEDTVEWDDLAPYEPLTVVMHQGVSYVSRRYVPTGIDIDDTTYWVETYRFNAQVEEYRQQVLTFQSQIDGVRETMEDDYVPFPDPLFNPKYGTAGQVLSTLADGSTKWDDPVVPSDEQAEAVITEWLVAHPEATTTVTDGSITEPKLNATLFERLFKYAQQVNYNNYQARLPTLGDAGPMTFYVVTMSEAAHQDDYPTGLGYGTYTLLTFGTSSYMEQYMWSTSINGNQAKRRYVNASWEAWEYTTSSTAISYYPTQVTTDNYAEHLPTVAAAPRNTVLCMVMSEATHQSDYPLEAGYGTVLLVTVGTSTYAEQYALALNPRIGFAKRRFRNNAWGGWDYNRPVHFGRNVNSSNYTANLPRLEDAEDNSIFSVSMTPTAKQPDYPDDLGYGTKTLVTIGNSAYRIQYLLNSSIEGVNALRRYVNNAWTDWEMSTPYTRKAVEIGPNGDYTSLTEGFDYAYTRGNCDVIVRNGSYDLVAELIAINGPDYFNAETFTDRGIWIGKGCTYRFEAGASVRAVLPSTSSSDAQNKFSAFVAGDGDFELVGLDVYTERCRYCVHDELDGTRTYHHVYRDCHMHHNDTGAGYIQCIGGGLGEHGLIDVVGCWFESDTAESSDEGIVSWHNGRYADSWSSIHIRNCYFKNGHVRFSWYGPSTQVSNMYVCGCSFKAQAVEERAESAASTVVNTKAYAWNNEIRGA